MRTRNFTWMNAMPIALTLLLLLPASTITITSAKITELNVNPQIVVQGDPVSISGKTSPNEVVWLSSSFELSLPVSEGEYARDFTDVYFPAGEKTFSVVAENVNNIRASLSPVFWQTIEYPLKEPENATEDGIATLSVSFPATMLGAKIDISGEKNVRVYGDAAEGATSVNLKSVMSIKVVANSTGYFELDINTIGAPEGEFVITAGGIEKAVEIVSVEAMPMPTPTPFPTPTSSPQKTTKPFRIPSFGFEAIGCIAIAAVIIIRKVKRKSGAQ